MRDLKSIAFAAMIASASVANAATAVLDFENISAVHAFLYTPVADYYNGGAAGNGVVGPDFGVQFTGTASAFCLNTPGLVCSGASAGSGGQPDFFAISLTSGGVRGSSYMNVASGFASALSFIYSMPFNTAADGAYVEVFSGLNGSGASLGKLVLSQTPQGITACPGYSASYCPFVSASIGFGGLARSAFFQAPMPIQGSGAIFDNITITAVPELQTNAMWLFGLAALSLGLRRRLPSAERAIAWPSC